MIHRSLSNVRTAFGVALGVAVLGLGAAPAVAVPTVINGAGSSTGINSGFGNAFGTNSDLAISSDALGNLDWTLTVGANTGGGSNLDGANAVVLYIDTDNGATGFESTTAFTDTGDTFFDELRAATSATNGTERADVTFAPGFRANYGLAINSGLAILFQLDTPSHTFIANATGAGFGAGGPYSFSHSMLDLGLLPGDSFRYVGTYLDPIGTFRSNEFHGVADASVSDNNIGFDDVTLSAGDFNTFNSVPEPASLALLGLGGVVLLGRTRNNA